MLLSIDVGSDSFFVAEGSYAGGCVNVVKTGEMKFPANTIEDGEVKNHASFIMSMNKLLASKSFKSSSVVFTFNSNQILSRRFELPASKPRDMAKMVKNEMLQMVNETSEYVYEYSIVNDTAVSANVKSVWAYAVPKDLVEEYYTVNRVTKLRPVALDIHPNSVEKLFLNSSVNGSQIGEKAVLFVNIEEENMEIHLFSDGQRAFSRITPVSSSDFSGMLGNIDTEGKSSVFDGLDITAEPFLNDRILTDTLHRYLSQVADEMQKMVQFQLRRNSSNPVTNIYIYGSMACIKGLAAEISTLLNIPVENVEAISTVKAQNISITKYINAIGSLIRL